MKNRQKIITAIKAANDEIINNEIDYMLDIDREERYDRADALDDILSIAEDNNDRRIIKKCRTILIAAGAFTPAPENNTTGRDIRFTHNGIKYDWPHSGGWDNWIER